MTILNKEFFRFLLMGVINTVATYAIYFFSMTFLSYTLSYTLSYVIGIFISYYLNSKFVFKEKFSLAKAFRFPLVYVVQYILSILLLRFFVEIILINKSIAPILIVIITVPITFLLSRVIIKERGILR